VIASTIASSRSSTAVEVSATVLTPDVFRMPWGCPVPEPAMIAISSTFPMRSARSRLTRRSMLGFELRRSWLETTARPATVNTLVEISPNVMSWDGLVASSATHPAVRPPVTLAMRSVSESTWTVGMSERRTARCARRSSTSALT
jgi:hypothetical protein